MNHDAIIEAAARALRDKVGSATFAGRSNLLPLSLDDLAKAVLTAVAPLIRSEALEEAAKAMEADRTERIAAIEEATLERAAKVAEGYDDAFETQGVIAAAIRALKEQP